MSAAQIPCFNLDMDLFNNESLRALAYALLNGGPEMAKDADQVRCFHTVEAAIVLLERRGRETSELREMLNHWGRGITRRGGWRAQ